MSKHLGNIAEAEFVTQCLKRSITICRTIGENNAYDYLLDGGGPIIRAQVKSTWTATPKGNYTVIAGHGKQKKPYGDKVDLIVVYVEPEDAWYFIPSAIIKSPKILLYPHKTGTGKYECYKGQWQLISTLGIKKGAE